MWKTIILASATLVCAGSAQAALLTVEITGTADGFDRAGVIGDPGSSFTGVAFISTFVFDPALGNRTTSVDMDTLSGGSGTRVPTNPLRSATLALGGQTLSFSGDYLASASYGTNDFLSFIAKAANGGLRTTSNLQISGGVTGLPSNLETPVVLDTAGAARLNGTFAVFDLGAPAGETLTIQGFLLVTGFATTVGLGGVGQVPEPASWSMMIAGFGLVGAAARRDRQARTARRRASSRSRRL